MVTCRRDERITRIGPGSAHAGRGQERKRLTRPHRVGTLIAVELLMQEFTWMRFSFSLRKLGRGRLQRRCRRVCLGSCVTSITGPNGGAELYER